MAPCFTHICGKTRAGRFQVLRKTISKRRRDKLRELNQELKRHRHLSIPAQGRWLRSVAQGHLNYYGVPGNLEAVADFIACEPADVVFDVGVGAHQPVQLHGLPLAIGGEARKRWSSEGNRLV